ncbi:hypothetical protein [Methylibium rhizosphaerae]|uniref:hypothetical protein n=1 Tax=Methylibium rhizosphaerae TaxID=2570323 RepID=UPI001128110C|nr:hypothetical protein [Methylibium rhizosphaerae]
METVSWATALQIVGWLLTVLGQVQVAAKSRHGFLTWIAANAVLIALCVQASLWWSIGMYVTNVGVCLWSFQRWARMD